MRKPISRTIIALLVGFSSVAYAESTAEALKNFDLIGTRSTDCATATSRSTYSVPVIGGPTVVTKSGQVSFERKIESAVRVTDEKITLTTIGTRIEGYPVGDEIGKRFEVVLQKFGKKFRVIHNKNGEINDDKAAVT